MRACQHSRSCDRQVLIFNYEVTVTGVIDEELARFRAHTVCACQGGGPRGGECGACAAACRHSLRYDGQVPNPITQSHKSLMITTRSSLKLLTQLLAGREGRLLEKNAELTRDLAQALDRCGSSLWSCWFALTAWR